MPSVGLQQLWNLFYLSEVAQLQKKEPRDIIGDNYMRS